MLKSIQKRHFRMNLSVKQLLKPETHFIKVMFSVRRSCLKLQTMPGKVLLP